MCWNKITKLTEAELAHCCQPVPVPHFRTARHYIKAATVPATTVRHTSGPPFPKHKESFFFLVPLWQHLRPVRLECLLPGSHKPVAGVAGAALAWSWPRSQGSQLEQPTSPSLDGKLV